MNDIEKKLIALQEAREQASANKVWFALKPSGPQKQYIAPYKKKKYIDPTANVLITPTQKILIDHYEFISRCVEFEQSEANVKKTPQAVLDWQNEHEFNIAVEDYKKKIKFVRNCTDRQVWDIIKNKFRKEQLFLRIQHDNKKTGS